MQGFHELSSEELEETKDINDVDRQALELWFQKGDDKKYLDDADRAVEEAKKKQMEAVEREVKAEELLLLLKQKEESLTKLRQPGKEKELQAWIRYEMIADQTMVHGLRKKFGMPQTSTDPFLSIPHWQ